MYQIKFVITDFFYNVLGEDSLVLCFIVMIIIKRVYSNSSTSFLQQLQT